MSPLQEKAEEIASILRHQKDFLTAWTSLGSLPVKEKLAEVF